jgi:hypothetical protein
MSIYPAMQKSLIKTPKSDQADPVLPYDIHRNYTPEFSSVSG